MWLRSLSGSVMRVMRRLVSLLGSARPPCFGLRGSNRNGELLGDIVCTKHAACEPSCFDAPRVVLNPPQRIFVEFDALCVRSGNDLVIGVVSHERMTHADRFSDRPRLR